MIERKDLWWARMWAKFVSMMLQVLWLSPWARVYHRPTKCFITAAKRWCKLCRTKRVRQITPLFQACLLITVDLSFLGLSCCHPKATAELSSQSQSLWQMLLLEHSKPRIRHLTVWKNVFCHSEKYKRHKKQYNISKYVFFHNQAQCVSASVV